MMKYQIITTNSEAEKLARYLLTLPAVAWDTETGKGKALTALDWVRGTSYWYQFSDRKKAWLVDIRKVDPLIFKKLLEHPGIIKIIHNSAFDAAWQAREHGIYVRNIWDTRYQEQIILGAAIPRDLKKADKERLEPDYSSSLKWCYHRRGYPSKFEFEEFQPLPHMPSKKQQQYMVRDVEFLHDLMEDQQRSITAMGLEDVSKLENEVAFITYNMMVNGFGVDVEGWMKYTAEEEKVFDECMRKLNKIAPINWNSWQQYCKFFGVERTDDLEHIKTPYQIPPTENGRTQHERYKALQLFREARKHYKNVNTYGRSWIAQHVAPDGRVHCQYTQMVNTARYSCDNPNLQNIPAETPHRSFMKPSHYKDDGRTSAQGVFVIADFSGQEMAIMAYGSGEESWLNCLRAGGDLHGMVAGDIIPGYKKLKTEERKIKRKQVKIINFSIVYGAGTETIAERAGTDTRTITTLLGEMKRKYKRLFRWLTSNGAEAKRSYESRSFPPFNRYRSLKIEPVGWRRVNIGKNNQVQMTAADMTKLSMYYFQTAIDEGLLAKFIHQLHDELIVECSSMNKQPVADTLGECMNMACEAILGERLSRPEVKIQKNWDKRKG